MCMCVCEMTRPLHASTHRSYEKKQSAFQDGYGEAHELHPSEEQLAAGREGTAFLPVHSHWELPVLL